MFRERVVGSSRMARAGLPVLCLRRRWQLVCSVLALGCGVTTDDPSTPRSSNGPAPFSSPSLAPAGNMPVYSSQPAATSPTPGNEQGPAANAALEMPELEAQKPAAEAPLTAEEQAALAQLDGLRKAQPWNAPVATQITQT
ncbi:MAG TPA: hypothetical protein VFS67_03525, partial [Polyangiaceae bacterium]|nr:hypothetical protein [Polyangiaceae bacterium]